MIYQEFNLVPDLGVIDNILLGIEPVSAVSFSIVKRRRTVRASTVLADLGITLPLDRPARRLSVARTAAHRDRESARTARATDRDGRTDRGAHRS